MEPELIVEISKWVLIVFVAGFIGYFGKYLSKIIIAKFSKKQKKEASQKIVRQYESPEKYKYQAEIEKQKAKIEKKKLKISKN